MVGLGETVTLAYEMSVMNAAPTESNLDQPGGTMVSPAQRGAQQYPQQPQQQQPQYSYTPPQQSQPQQVSPYQQSQPQASPYGQPQSSYSPASAAPPVPGGYEGEYDPYAVREEEPRNTTRWILIGCAGLALFCYCATVLGLVFIDQACLWDRIPVVWQVLQAFGYTQLSCGA
jgi:hypothetical protein